MRSCDVLIVGGGPAGSTAAWQLRRAGADVLVLDRERFPRLKLCAGWITPEVVHDLALDIGSYPHRLLTFPRLRVHMGRWHVPVPCVQHSIRRFEFDAWLLERSGVVAHRNELEPAAAAAYSDRTGVYVGSGGGNYENQYDYFPLLALATSSEAGCDCQKFFTLTPSPPATSPTNT